MLIRIYQMENFPLSLVGEKKSEKDRKENPGHLKSLKPFNKHLALSVKEEAFECQGFFLSSLDLSEEFGWLGALFDSPAGKQNERDRKRDR